MPPKNSTTTSSPVLMPEVLSTLELVDFYVGYDTTTILVEYTLSNFFGYSSGELTQRSYGYYQIPMEILEVSYLKDKEEQIKKLKAYLYQDKIELPSIDNCLTGDNLLSSLAYSASQSQITNIQQTVLIMSSKEKLVKEILIDNLKAALPALSRQKFLLLSVGLHEMPGSLIEKRQELHASKNQKIFAPYYFLTLEATLDKNKLDFSAWGGREFEKEVFLNTLARPIGKKIKIKYDLSVMIRNDINFMYRWLGDTEKKSSLHLNKNNYVLEKTNISPGVKSKMNTQPVELDLIKGLNFWYTQQLPTALFKRYEKRKLESILAPVSVLTAPEASTFPVSTLEKRKAHKI